jgi:NhaP-type Na+/H+ or K+/H+ antiporter
VVTAVGATLAARFIMGWDWRLATVFGTLVIVTGPTVVTPLLRRLRLKDPVNTILQAEGVLIDPIGAIIAVVALEVLYAEGATLRRRSPTRPASSASARRSG